jgi:hypothetical protein
MIQELVHVLASVLIAYAILSLIEYMFHRHLMHAPRLARMARSKYLLDTFAEHAQLHHHSCYEVFDREPGGCGAINIRIRSSSALLVVMLPALAVLLIDELTCLVMVVGAFVNCRVWSAFHAEMHHPRSAWFAHNPVFTYLRRWHYLHHRHPGRNFNTLFLMWDWILGTAAVATEVDRAEMQSGTWRVRILAAAARSD